MKSIKSIKNDITKEYSRRDILEERMNLAVILGSTKESELLINSF